MQSACQNYGIMKLQYKGCSLSISVFLVFNECISLGAQLQSDKDVKLLKSHSAMIKRRPNFPHHLTVCCGQKMQPVSVPASDLKKGRKN